MYTYRTLERPQMTAPQRRRMPPERHLQALDLPLRRHAGPQPFGANDEYAAGGHFAATPRHVTYERQAAYARDPRAAQPHSSSDYDYSMPQTPSRSWSMIDLPSARRKQLTTRMKGGGGDPYGCDANNDAEEEPADFYYAGHPGIGQSQEPPEFLSVDNAYQRQSPSQRTNSYAAGTPLRPLDTMYSTDPAQRRRMPFSSSQQGGQPSMDRYRDMRGAQSQPQPSPSPAPAPPSPASPAWQRPMPRIRTDLQMGRLFEYSVPYRQIQTEPALMNVSSAPRRSSQATNDRWDMWESPYRQQTPTFMRDYEPYQPTPYNGPVTSMYTNGSQQQQQQQQLPSTLSGISSFGMSGSPAMDSSCMGEADMDTPGMGAADVGPSYMGAAGAAGAAGKADKPGKPGKAGAAGAVAAGRGQRASYTDDSNSMPNACNEQDPCARQNIPVPRCGPKPKPDPCSTEREALQCLACSTQEQEEATGKQCTYFNAKIAAKMDKCLPMFCIPRGMEEDFNCKKRRELWDGLVRDNYCPGAIQDTTDCKEDFNVLAMDIVFGNSRIPDTLPCNLDPITLLEAFWVRINYERCQIKKLEDTLRQDEQPDKPTEPNDDCTQIEKCFRRKYQTEVNLSIEKFLKAERIFNFLHPEPEVPEMSLSVDKISTDVPGVPIKICAYTGITKPKNP